MTGIGGKVTKFFLMNYLSIILLLLTKFTQP